MLNPFTWIFLFLHPLQNAKMREYLVAIDNMPLFVPSLILAFSFIIYGWLIFFLMVQLRGISRMVHFVRGAIVFGLGLLSAVPMYDTIASRVETALFSVDAGEPVIISILPNLTLYGFRTALLPLDLSGLTTLFATEGTAQRVLDSLIYLTPEGIGLIAYPLILILILWGQTARWARLFFAGAALSFSILPATIVLLSGYFA